MSTQVVEPTEADVAGAPPHDDEDDETTREALAYLKAVEEAEGFTPGQLGDAATPPPAPATSAPRPRIEYTAPGVLPRTYQAPPPNAPPVTHAQAVAASAPAAPPMPKGIHNIEDLYATYPDVGNGEVFLRVERTQPKGHQGVPVAGVLCDIHEQITMDEFAAMFGGHAYLISVLGPPLKGRSDADAGRPRTLANFELKVPGHPVMNVFPVGLEDASMQPVRPGMPPRQPQMYSQQGFVPVPGYPPQAPESVLLEEVKIRARAQERDEAMRERLLESARTPTESIKTANEIARDTVAIARASADEKVAILREQIGSLTDDLRQRDSETRDLRDKLSAAQRDAAEARQYHETEQIRQLKEQHAETLHRERDTFAKELARVQQESRDKLDAETRRHVEERARADSDAAKERERLREDAERRVQAIKEQLDLARTSMKDNYEARLSDLDRRTTEQIAAIKETRDREIQSVTSMERNNSLVIEKTTKVQADSLAQQVMKLEGENERLRRENDDLRKKSVKDPVTYIQEVDTFARNVLGMVKPDEVEKNEGAASENGDPSWKTVATRGLMGLIDGIPQIAEKIGQVRAVNQAQAAAQQQQQQGGGMRQLPPGTPQAQAQAMAAAQQAQRRRSLLASRPAWLPAGPPPPGAPIGVPQPHVGPVMGPPPGPVMAPVRSLVTGAMDAPPPAPPVTGEMTASSVQSPVQLPPSPQELARQQAAFAEQQAAQQYAAPPPQPMAPSPQAQQQTAVAPKVSQEQMAMFLGALNQHFGEGTPPRMFAMGFVDQVGKDAARDLMATISAQSFVQALEDNGVDETQTRLLTLDGREYVEKVWAEAKKICAAQ